MDIITELNGMSFEWDKNKEKLNYKKHRISFDTAIKVFNDENRLEFYDEGHSTYEDRFITIPDGVTGKIYELNGSSLNELIRSVYRVKDLPEFIAILDSKVKGN